MTARCKLSEIAKTIRSKNAGVDKITFDILYEPYLLSILKFTRAGNFLQSYLHLYVAHSSSVRFL